MTIAPKKTVLLKPLFVVSCVMLSSCDPFRELDGIDTEDDLYYATRQCPEFDHPDLAAWMPETVA